jgi:Ca2+-binding RTX toxin-like protein
MAKLVVTTQMVDGATVYDYSDILTLRRHSSDFAQLIDDSGYEFVIRGKNLLYDGADIIGGKITSVALLDTEGTLCSAVTDTELDPSVLHPTSHGAFGLDAFFYALAGDDRCVGSAQDDLLMGGDGDDVMIGKNGQDRFWSGSGNDRMTGGKGADYFQLQAGRDIITDFESEGVDALHDHIETYASSWEVRKAGNDTVIKFNEGTSARLLDFKSTEFDDTDVRELL